MRNACYNTATKLCTTASTATVLFHTRTLSRPIFGSGIRGKQQAHGCASSTDEMARTVAIEKWRDRGETFWQVVNESVEGCAKKHHA